jgi:hypothetical protein
LVLLPVAAVIAAGGYTLARSASEPDEETAGAATQQGAPRTESERQPATETGEQRTETEEQPKAAKRDPAEESGDASKSYLQEERCQPIDDMNDPGDGTVPSPEELLPDPDKCPEFYAGRKGAQGAAPPVSGVPPVPQYEPPSPSQTPSYDPCAETESLNGFPCYSTPSGPVYPP